MLLEHGRSVRLHVEEELRQGRDPATTQLPHSVELSALEKLRNLKNVTHSLVQLTVVGRLLGHGLDARMAVVMEHRRGQGHVPTLPQPTVEDHALEILYSRRIVIKQAVVGHMA